MIGEAILKTGIFLKKKWFLRRESGS
jgi:hypothetical protein